MNSFKTLNLQGMSTVGKDMSDRSKSFIQFKKFIFIYLFFIKDDSF